MCLAVPGRVVRWLNREPVLAEAEIEFEGVRRVCHMACVLGAEEGDYVIVHAGVAISRIDEQAARQTLDDLSRMHMSEEPAAHESPLNREAGSRDAFAADTGLNDQPKPPPQNLHTEGRA